VERISGPFGGLSDGICERRLLAGNQLHYLTGAFGIGAAFNLVANVILIQRYGFVGAAVTTVLSEIVLFVPFYYSVRKHITALPFVDLFWRPIVASAVMGVVVWLMRGASLLVIVPAAVIVYAAMLLALGAVTKEDWELVKSVRG